MEILQLAKHELLESVEHLLTPQTLSDLVQDSISHVWHSPFADRLGTSNSDFEWVTAVSNGGTEKRYALKRIQFKTDWFMIHQ